MRNQSYVFLLLLLLPFFAAGQLKPAGLGYDVKHYRIKQEINPDTLYIRGSVQFTFQKSITPFSSFTCHLSDALNIDSVVYQGSRLPFNHQNSVVSVAVPVQPNTLDSIEIFYSGVPGGGGGFSSFAKSAHGGGNAIYTLSQPYGASDWWPCKNTLDDKADSLDIYLTVPIGNTAVTNGLLVDSSMQNAMMTYHWKHRHPIATYLVAIAITKYIYYVDTILLKSGKLVTQHNYIYPSSIAKAQLETPALAPAMILFSDLFGDYPFANEKYGHAQFGWGGGMEHQTISFVGNFGHDLLVHELAHQWFGDLVTCGSWEDLWLNEGFATYLTGVAHEKCDTNPISFVEWKARTIDAVMAQPGGSIYNKDTLNINRLFDNRLTYNKPAMMLHMLRLTMGDDAFFAACRTYLNTYRNSFSRFAWFIDIFGQFYNKDLKYFFSQWLYGEGYPIYDITWMDENEPAVRVTVQQRTSVNSVDFFKLPLPLRFYKGTAHFDTLVLNAYNGQTFQFILPWKADSMSFNTEYDLVAEGTVTYLGKTSSTSNPIILYPNNGNRLVSFECRFGNTVNGIDLYSTDGKCIRQTDTLQPLLNGKFDFSDLPAGIYLLRFRLTGGKEETLKLLLQ